jgi:RNA-binding protein NOB1
MSEPTRQRKVWLKNVARYEIGVQRFALRCEACFNISLASAKAFCARCGNGGTMKKVTMQVDANGVVQFGVRKRHNIRGTRYSLPQPKGGREAKNPILREDQLIKMGASRKAKVSQRAHSPVLRLVCLGGCLSALSDEAAR